MPERCALPVAPSAGPLAPRSLLSSFGASAAVAAPDASAAGQHSSERSLDHLCDEFRLQIEEMVARPSPPERPMEVQSTQPVPALPARQTQVTMEVGMTLRLNREVSYNEYALPAGLTGTVVAVDEDGDALVAWESLGQEDLVEQWLLRSNFPSVDVETAARDVAAAATRDLARAVVGWTDSPDFATGLFAMSCCEAKDAVVSPEMLWMETVQ